MAAKRGWDATSHEDLLLSYMDVSKANKRILIEVTESMKTKGYSFSYDAIKYLNQASIPLQ